jgi:hypothetical protein
MQSPDIEHEQTHLFPAHASPLFWFHYALVLYLDRSFNPTLRIVECPTYAPVCTTFHDKPLSGALTRDVDDAFAEYRIAISGQGRQRA